MKKYIESLMLVMFTLIAFTACKDEPGTSPGGDGTPAVTVYTFDAMPPLNSDNDVVVRVAANNATEAVYYLVETTEAYAERLASLGEAGFADYVVSNGKQVQGLGANGSDGASIADFNITDMMGENTISFVAVNGGTKKLAKAVAFKGLAWEDITAGTYYFADTNKGLQKLGLTTAATTLQKCTNESGLFRLKDVFGNGYSLKFRTNGVTGTDDNGDYQQVRVAAQPTPYTYLDYGAVSVRDLAYWQNSDDYIDCSMYESGYCYFWIHYFVPDGSIGYGYDEFVPAE